MTRRLIVLASALLAFSALADDCAEKWPSDFEMQAYCKDEQTKAAINISKYFEKYGIDLDEVKEKIESGNASDLSVPETIVVQCVSDWNNDLEMVFYCINNQTKAAKRLGKIDP